MARDSAWQPSPGYKEFFEKLEAGGLGYGFHLCCTPVQLGSVKADQIWMDTRTIYGQRGKPAVNLQPMADYFWMRCFLAQTYLEPDVQESYLLAHLCPHTRGTASQKVMIDARVGRPGRPASVKQAEVNELEAYLLQISAQPLKKDRQLTMIEFHRRTAGILGMPEFEEAEVAAYRELSDLLFTEARKILVDLDRSPGKACDAALAAWKTLTNTIGRRSGQRVAARKTAMNVLSYEARAAVHRCYSAVWNDLIPHLEAKYKLPSMTAKFLRLMHTERITPSTDPKMNFHLFHGHVFALHPGMSTLMRTPTGQRLMGEYLEARTAAEESDRFERLLMGIYVSLCEYTGLRYKQQTSRQERRPGKRNLDNVIDTRSIGRSGRRRSSKKLSDE